MYLETKIISVYDIVIYETASKNRPVEKYMADLLDEHKDNDVAEIKLYFKKLEKYGLAINTEFKKNAVKKLNKKIYELRPSNTRVFFFCYKNGRIILLHAWEKKQQKTDPKEIDKAENEMNDYLRRVK